MSDEAKIEAKLFSVELSYPHHYEAADGRPLVTHRNEQRHIFCTTAERAMELAHDAHHDATIHVVRNVGARKPVIIDPALLDAYLDERL